MSNLGHLMTQKFGLVNDLVGKGVCHPAQPDEFCFLEPMWWRGTHKIINVKEMS